MTPRTKLALTALAGTLVAAAAVGLVSSASTIGARTALAGVLLLGATFVVGLAVTRISAPALLTGMMFAALLPLLVIAGEHAFLLWAGGWALVAYASRPQEMSAPEVRTPRYDLEPVTIG